MPNITATIGPIQHTEAPNAVAILADLGFHDRSHFTRLFRRRWGCPPAEYRRRQGG